MVHPYSFVLLAGLLPVFAVQAADLAYPNRFGSMAESMVDMMDAFSQAYQKRGRENGGGSGWQSPQSGGNWSMSSNPWSSMGSNPWSMGSSPWSSMAANPWSMGGSPWSSMAGSPWSSMAGSPWSSMPGSPWSMGGNPWSQLNNMPGYPAFGPNAQVPYGQPSGWTGALDGSWQGQSGEILAVQSGRFRIYLDRDRYQEGRIELLGKDLLSMQGQNSGTARRYEYAVHEGRLVLRDEAGNLLLYRRVP